MCGIFAIFSSNKNKNIGNQLINGLKLLQHRGKDGYGMVYYTKDHFRVIKKKGIVKMNNLYIDCRCCIGHNRYSTSGNTIENGTIKKNELQPLRGFIGSKYFYLVHNGNIPFIKGHDTTTLVNLINALDNMDIEQRLIYIMNTISAAYCLILLYDNKLYVLRDRYGIRPLCIGKYQDSYYVSSESYGLGDIPFMRNVAQGEILKIDCHGITQIYQHPKSQVSLCTFEILYFSNENSVIDGYNIKNIRQQLSTKLAEKENLVLNNHIVIGIPLTGILLGKAYAKRLGLRYEQWITKNPNTNRTFIIKTDKERKIACMKKFCYNTCYLRGRNIIIVDDTIVRGTVITAIIKNLRNIGVNEIHVRIPAPPVIDICLLGISIQSKRELIKTNRTVNEVCAAINADSLKYLTLKDISDFIPKKSYNHCFSGYIEKGIIMEKTNKHIVKKQTVIRR